MNHRHSALHLSARSPFARTLLLLLISGLAGCGPAAIGVGLSSLGGKGGTSFVPNPPKLQPSAVNAQQQPRDDETMVEFKLTQPEAHDASVALRYTLPGDVRGEISAASLSFVDASTGARTPVSDLKLASSPGGSSYRLSWAHAKDLAAHTPNPGQREFRNVVLSAVVTDVQTGKQEVFGWEPATIGREAAKVASVTYEPRANVQDPIVLAVEYEDIGGDPARFVKEDYSVAYTNKTNPATSDWYACSFDVSPPEELKLGKSIGEASRYKVRVIVYPLAATNPMPRQHFDQLRCRIVANETFPAGSRFPQKDLKVAVTALSQPGQYQIGNKPQIENVQIRTSPVRLHTPVSCVVNLPQATEPVPLKLSGEFHYKNEWYPMSFVDRTGATQNIERASEKQNAYLLWESGKDLGLGLPAATSAGVSLVKVRLTATIIAKGDGSPIKSDNTNAESDDKVANTIPFADLPTELSENAEVYARSYRNELSGKPTSFFRTIPDGQTEEIQLTPDAQFDPIPPIGITSHMNSTGFLHVYPTSFSDGPNCLALALPKELSWIHWDYADVAKTTLKAPAKLTVDSSFTIGQRVNNRTAPARELTVGGDKGILLAGWTPNVQPSDTSCSPTSASPQFQLRLVMRNGANYVLPAPYVYGDRSVPANAIYGFFGPDKDQAASACEWHGQAFLLEPKSGNVLGSFKDGTTNPTFIYACAGGEYPTEYPTLHGLFEILEVKPGTTAGTYQIESKPFPTLPPLPVLANPTLRTWRLGIWRNPTDPTRPGLVLMREFGGEFDQTLALDIRVIRQYRNGATGVWLWESQWQALPPLPSSELPPCSGPSCSWIPRISGLYSEDLDGDGDSDLMLNVARGVLGKDTVEATRPDFVQWLYLLSEFQGTPTWRQMTPSDSPLSAKDRGPEYEDLTITDVTDVNGDESLDLVFHVKDRDRAPPVGLPKFFYQPNVITGVAGGVSMLGGNAGNAPGYVPGIADVNSDGNADLFIGGALYLGKPLGLFEENTSTLTGLGGSTSGASYWLEKVFAYQGSSDQLDLLYFNKGTSEGWFTPILNVQYKSTLKAGSAIPIDTTIGTTKFPIQAAIPLIGPVGEANNVKELAMILGPATDARLYRVSFEGGKYVVKAMLQPNVPLLPSLAVMRDGPVAANANRLLNRSNQKIVVAALNSSDLYQLSYLDNFGVATKITVGEANETVSAISAGLFDADDRDDVLAVTEQTIPGGKKVIRVNLLSKGGNDAPGQLVMRFESQGSVLGFAADPLGQGCPAVLLMNKEVRILRATTSSRFGLAATMARSPIMELGTNPVGLVVLDQDRDGDPEMYGRQSGANRLFRIEVNKP